MFLCFDDVVEKRVNIASNSSSYGHLICNLDHASKKITFEGNCKDSMPHRPNTAKIGHTTAQRYCTETPHYSTDLQRPHITAQTKNWSYYSTETPHYCTETPRYCTDPETHRDPTLLHRPRDPRPHTTAERPHITAQRLHITAQTQEYSTETPHYSNVIPRYCTDIRTSEDLSGKFLLKSTIEPRRKGILDPRTVLRASRVSFLNAMMIPTMVVRATRSSESTGQKDIV